MLTPQEIADKVFVKAVFGGYDMTGVDDFLESVSNDYAALYKDNAILKSKLKVLVEKVEEYRSTEDSMRMALLTAQRMGDEIIDNANKRSAEIIRAADETARARSADTERRVAEEEVRVNAAMKETAKFIEFSRVMMAKHSDFLTKLEKARLTVTSAESPVPGTPAPPEPRPVPQAVDSPTHVIGTLPTSGEGPGREPVSSAQAPAQNLEGQGLDTSPTIEYSIKDIKAAEDSADAPIAKFDLDNLKFGVNFNDEN